MSKTNDSLLIILRHCHRDTSDRHEDNGLSAKGRRQGQALADYFQRRRRENSLLETPHLLSSPKLRCLETIQFISEVSASQVHIDERLNEQQDHPDKKLIDRLEDFIHSWKTSKYLLTFACSHGDIIPLLLESLLNQDLSLKKGGWAEISLRKGQPELISMVQDFGI